VIRVITLDSYDDKHLAKLCKVLYTAFGVGCEHAKELKVPAGFDEPLEAFKMLEAADGVRAYADDKLLYLTPKKLKDRTLPSGNAPTHGCAVYGKERALITTAGVKDMEEQMKLVARHALHQLGHLWELHHCLDPRCSMYPPWTPSFPLGDSIFCTYCREKSEQKIRLASS
jgi:predicted Zn-dependent protease